jgi:hypothetical protein
MLYKVSCVLTVNNTNILINILLCWLYTFDMMSPWGWRLCVETCSRMHMYVTNGISQSTYCGWYIDCSLTLHCDTIPLKLPLINIGTQLYVISPLLVHFVLSILKCSTPGCTFVFWLCWIETDTCEYPYHRCHLICLIETY